MSWPPDPGTLERRWVDQLSDGELLELLTEAALVVDPMPEVARVQSVVLAEVVRRLTAPVPVKATVSVRAVRRAKRARKEAEQYHAGP